MKRIKKLIIILFLLLICPNNVFAHPGRTDSNGCHTCRSNCEAWGLHTGEYHCHNQNSYSNSNNSDNSATNNVPVYVNSSNANLKSLTIDGENIDISDTMNFSTVNDNPSIVALSEHEKASVEVNKPSYFSNNFQNKVIIIVTAEDGTKKEYILFIKLISNDATLKRLYINEQEYELMDEISFSTSDSKIIIDAVTSNKNAKILSDMEYELKNGNNKIIIKVMAEDEKTVKEYILNVSKSDKTEETVSIVVILVVGMISGIFLANKYKNRDLFKK